MTELSAFIHLFFYQLETIITNNFEQLNTVSFQSEEANTDKELKIFFKEYIMHNNRLLDGCDCLNVKCIRQDREFCFNADSLSKYYIEDVFLPSELTLDIKEFLRSQKSAVYTNPDLLLAVSNGDHIEYVSLELKSTKGDKIPGSSIQQVAPFEWVIFVQHNISGLKVITGQYINSITSRLPFPDRSPRPEISFNNLDKWNGKNRFIQGQTLVFDNRSDDTAAKLSILSDWHNYLADEWLNTTVNAIPTNTEKWFNHTLRLFSLKLLSHYDALSDQDKKVFISTLEHRVNS